MSEVKGLRVFVSVDMEGISGVVHGSQTSEGGEYERGRTLMVGDVNAAIEGILSVGSGEIVVSDGHGGMRNLRPEDLHEAAILARGTPKPLTQMSGISPEFDAALFIGYHAKKGTLRAILDHTISAGIIDSISINGLEVGETAINAAIAGYYGVPLVFLSGDLAVTREVESLIPEVTTVSVKEGISRTGARCIHPKRAHGLIKQGVAEALRRRSGVKPFRFTPPIEVKARYVNSVMADAVEFMPLAERIDGSTVRFMLDDYIKAFGALRASIFIASAVST